MNVSFFNSLTMTKETIDSKQLTSIWTIATDIGDTNIKNARLIANGNYIECNRTVAALVQVYVHVLA